MGSAGSNGLANPPGTYKEITAPAGPARLCLGIADAWRFNGASGYYDDNDGEYAVRVDVDQIPTNAGEA